MDEIKRDIVSTYGKKPTICYYYYLWNVIDYAGEERVRKSFDSIRGQGNEVIIGIYNSTDSTKELAEEYGFKVVEVEKGAEYIIDKDLVCMFPESKIRNKVIATSQSNFLVALNINIEYPKGLNRFIANWIRKNNIVRKALRLRSKFESGQFYGFSTVIYRPYLIEARGYDERTSYGFGSQKYGAMLLKEVYKMRIHAFDLNLIHKYNDHFKLRILNEIFKDIEHKRRREKSVELVQSIKETLQEDFYKGVNGIHNSYW